MVCLVIKSIIKLIKFENQTHRWGSLGSFASSSDSDILIILSFYLSLPIDRSKVLYLSEKPTPLLVISYFCMFPSL